MFFSNNPRRIALLGSSGSIGQNALDVIEQSGGRLKAQMLSVHSRVELLVEQAIRVRPETVIIVDKNADRTPLERLPSGVEILFGAESLCEYVQRPEIDVVLSAIVGQAGLESTWAALEAGKTVALANKESLVCAGSLILELLRERGGAILPVDSEHSAIFQSLQAATLNHFPLFPALYDFSLDKDFEKNLDFSSDSLPVSTYNFNNLSVSDSEYLASKLFLSNSMNASISIAKNLSAGISSAEKDSVFFQKLEREYPVDFCWNQNSEEQFRLEKIWKCFQQRLHRQYESIRRLILTASGGPFRTFSAQKLEQVTAADALNHPTWRMGPKITIDSATMMNKALEIIEARWLFNIPSDKIDVRIHPQSIIHSMVEFVDGAVLAQMSPPDMRLPIQLAMEYPYRFAGATTPMDWTKIISLELIPPDLERFPAIRLGHQVAELGGSAGVVVNAANEIAVRAFLDGKLSFPKITELCQKILEYHQYESHPTLSRLFELDRWARKETEIWIGEP